MAERYCESIKGLINEMNEKSSNLERELDHYRGKIWRMQERDKMRTELMSEIQNMKMPIMPAVISILESIPKDMRDRIFSIEQTADGTVSIFFDTNVKEGK